MTILVKSYTLIFHLSLKLRCFFYPIHPDNMMFNLQKGCIIKHNYSHMIDIPEEHKTVVCPLKNENLVNKKELFAKFDEFKV